MSIKPHPTIESAWIIRWYPAGRKGKREYITVYNCTEAEAREHEMALRRSPDGRLRNEVNPPLRQVFPEWIRWMELHRSPRTVESILWALKHLEPHFGNLTVAQITEATINQYKQKRRHAPRACNLELDYLKSMIGWMVKRRLCNPLTFQIERLPYERPLPRIPSPEDLERWLENVETDGEWDPATKTRRPGPKNALIWIMVRCGLRFREAVNLRWEDIDWNQGVIYVRETKGGKHRFAVLPDEAREILEPMRFEPDTRPPKKKTGLVAPNRNGEPYGHMKTLFKTASERSGVPIKGPHTLRHICGTYTLEATGDLRLVQNTLGHTQSRTTELYTQTSIARLRQGQQLTTAHTRKKNTTKES